MQQTNLIQISDEEFALLTKLVYDVIGIHLTEQKKNLVMGRLQKVLKSNNFTNFREYYNYVVADKTGLALSELATLISTNHTYFYREKEHYDFFSKQALPELEKSLKTENSSDIRIWSAGCSSGEEPYNLLMLMYEYFKSDYAKYIGGILGTDISEKVLKLAQNGIYTYERINRLPKPFINKYFTKISQDSYQVLPELRREVTYRRFNLMNKVFPFKKKFHIIFCRNVMIYFDEPTRLALVERFYNSLLPGGYLFIGHSETINKSKTRFKYIKPALYKK